MIIIPNIPHTPSPVDAYIKAKDETKATYDVKAEWSMAIKDIERIDKICYALDLISVSARLYNHAILNKYSALLYSLFMNLRPLINESEKTSYEDKFTKVNNEVFRIANLATRGRVVRPQRWLLTDMVSIHKDLLQLKQNKGLGIPTSKVLSDELKWSRGFGVE